MKKKALISMICALMLLGTAGCGNSGQNSSTPSSNGSSAGSSSSSGSNEESEEATNLTAPGTLPIVNEPVTLTAYAVQTVQVENLQTNEATVELEKRTNVNLDLQIVMETVASEKRNLMLTSGDYPEIFLSGAFSASDVATYGADQGILIPLNDLIDKNCVNIQKSDESIPGYMENIKANDGNIYAIPSINECFHCIYPGKLWMNTAWLDTLELSIPQTTEEMREVLTAIKNNDPNGNGLQDEIPLMGTNTPSIFLYFMNSFLTYDGTNFTQKDGKLHFVANTDEFRAGLSYIHSLYMDGLIDPTTFTQTLDQLRTICNQDTILVGAVPTLHVRQFCNMDTDNGERHKMYNSIPPLKGPEGHQTSALGVLKLGPGGAFAITDACKNPEVAIRLIDYLYSEEGTLLMDAGVEGSGWEYAKEGEMNPDGEPAKYTITLVWSGSDMVQNVHWHQQAPTFRNAAYRNSFSSNQDIYTPEGFETRLNLDTKNNYQPYRSDEVISKTPAFTKEQNDIMTQVGVNLETFITQSMVQFVTGDRNLETEWETYKQELENMGLQQYIAVHAEAFGLELE